MSVEDIKRAQRLPARRARRGARRRQPTSSATTARCCSSSTASTSRTTATSAASARQQKLAARLLVHGAGVGARAAGSRAEQWLALDRLADLADGTMRLTTRQGVQFHVVHKGELHELVARHQRAAADDAGRVRRRRAQRHGLAVARRAPGRRSSRSSPPSSPASARRPRRTGSCGSTASRRCTAAAGAAAVPRAEGSQALAEPIYGDVYLPRKFKIAVAWPGDNNVDVLANDVGIVPTLTDGTDRRRHRLQRATSAAASA